MPRPRFATACLPACLLAGCTSVAGPAPGTVEFRAAQVSRAYDCGLRVDRAGVIAGLPQAERRRFVLANAAYAVKSYNAPKRCESGERETLQLALRPARR
jgi:hypothetical protein